ncbi:MAG: TCP-1/cpn60 chaperonin family protein, partial [Pseudomonadota bacterium]
DALLQRQFFEALRDVFADGLVNRSEQSGIAFRMAKDLGQIAVQVLRDEAEGSLRQIAENAGVDGSVVVGKVIENDSRSFGFDAQAEEYVDMLKAGVIDPTKVVRIALENAASIAGLLITTEAMVAQKPKEGGAGNEMSDMGGMGGMM